MPIKFGTEGWRAVIAEEFTFANVRLVAQAIADYYRHRTSRGGGPTIGVGYDGRFLSREFAQTVAQVLAGNGLTVFLSDRLVPTPAVSANVKAHHWTGGVMVTASHNPATFNGLKVKEAFGGSAEPATVAAIEAAIGRHPVKETPLGLALAKRSVRWLNFQPAHQRALRDAVDLRAIKKLPFKVLVDSMHGAGGALVEELLAGGRCHVTTLHPDPRPDFGGLTPEPIARHLEALSREVRRTQGHVGIATDGDADRIGVMDGAGRFVSPGKLLCVLLKYLVTERGLRGGVVTTISNTMLIERLATKWHLPLHETPVGFKHIAKLMRSESILIGGEESGGIGVAGYLPERDGLFIGLLLLEVMAKRRRSFDQLLEELDREFGAFAAAREDVACTADVKESFFARLSQVPPSELAGQALRGLKTFDGIKLIGQDDSWLLFRASGTEPIVRIYAEAATARRARALVAWGKELAFERR